MEWNGIVPRPLAAPMMEDLVTWMH